MLDDADSPAADSRELTSPGEDSGDGGERSEPKVPDGDETALEQEEGPEALSGEQDSSRQPGKSPDMGERLLGLQRPRDADDNLNTRQVTAMPDGQRGDPGYDQACSGHWRRQVGDPVGPAQPGETDKAGAFVQPVFAESARLVIDPGEAARSAAALLAA